MRAISLLSVTREVVGVVAPRVLVAVREIVLFCVVAPRATVLLRLTVFVPVVRAVVVVGRAVVLADVDRAVRATTPVVLSDSC